MPLQRMLDEVYAITGDQHRTLQTGCEEVWATSYSKSLYYGLVDYAVSSSLGGGCIILVPRQEPKPPE